MGGKGSGRQPSEELNAASVPAPPLTPTFDALNAYTRWATERLAAKEISARLHRGYLDAAEQIRKHLVGEYGQTKIQRYERALTGLREARDELRALVKEARARAIPVDHIGGIAPQKAGSE